MCGVLELHGMHANHLRVLWQGTANPAGSAVVVATPVVRSDLGARLSSVYAPGVIASFGSGDQRIDVRAIAPRGAAAYRAASDKDLFERKLSEAALVSQVQVALPATAKSELMAGRVDSRLIVLIADLAASQSVTVVAFGDASPGVATAPLRSAEVRVTSDASRQSMLATLRKETQLNPAYRPSHITTMRLPTGQTVLNIEVAAPSPLGIFG